MKDEGKNRKGEEGSSPPYGSTADYPLFFPPDHQLSDPNSFTAQAFLATGEGERLA